MKKSLKGHVQVSQHPRAKQRASAELVVSKNVTTKESETDCVKFASEYSVETFFVVVVLLQWNCKML